MHTSKKEQRGSGRPELEKAQILAECAAFRAFRAAYQRGARGAQLPLLPRATIASPLKVFLVSTLLHSLLRVLEALTATLGLGPLARWLVGLRIRTDHLSWEPGACGLHQAHTRLGVIQARSGDLDRAIESLERSWHVHPCPHTTSAYGLMRSLRNTLAEHEAAAEAVAEFDAMARAFGQVPP